MSNDRKPGKVQMVSGAGANITTPVSAAAAGGPAHATRAASRSSGMLLSVMFLIGAAIGGAGAAKLGLG